MQQRELREAVLQANLDLVRSRLVTFTFGNASGIARDAGLIAIKPSGVDYAELTAESIVLLDLEGKVVDGKLRPSSDWPTHLVLYQSFPEIGGVAHTHSEFATAWAQAKRPIPCLGTTHADYFHGEVPVTEAMEPHEIANGYEHHTGQAIARAFRELDYRAIAAVLVANHGPFTWGAGPKAAAHNAAALETIARMAYRTCRLNPEAGPIARELHQKHFTRKHGSTRYYGQEEPKH